MGLVNVVLPDGRVVSVDEDTAKTSRLGLEGTQAAEQREAATARHEAFGGVGGAVSEALTSAGDTMSFGLLGKAAEGMAYLTDGSDGVDRLQRARQASAEENPTAHVVGEVGAMLLPTGLLGDTAKGVGELTGLGAAARIGEGVGEYAGKNVGRAVEGGLFGIGAHVADTNITGDPLTIEGAVESAGLGAILNLGGGLVMDKLAGGVEGFADAADARLQDATKLRGDIETAQRGSKVFTDTPPSWQEFRESHEAAEKSIGSYNRAVTRDTEAYQGFMSTNTGIGSATEKAQAAINRIRNEAVAEANQSASATRKALEESPAWNDLRDVHNGSEAELGKANKTIQRANDEHAAMVGSNEKLTGAIDEAEQLIKSRRGMYSDVERNPTQLDASKPPITPELRGKLDAYDARISDMYKRKAGGWTLNGAKAWARDASVAADPAGALEDLRRLHTDLAADMPKGSGKLADLPAAPQELRPASGIKVPMRLTDVGQMSDVQIGKLARSISPEANAALSKLARDVGVKEGGSAEQTLTAIRERVRGGGQVPLDPALRKSLDGYTKRLNDIRELRATNPQAAVESLRGLKAICRSSLGVL